MTKLVKYAGITSKVLSVLRVIVIVISALAAVTLLAGIVLARLVVDAFHNSSTGFWTFTNGVLQLRIAPSAVSLTAGDVRWLCALLLVALGVVAALTLRLIRLLADAMSEMRDGRPFSPSMTTTVRRVAVVMLIYAFVTPLIPLIPTWFVIGSLHTAGMPGLQISYQYNVNGLAIIAGLALLLLSLVFDYGAQLQQQSDETL